MIHVPLDSSVLLAFARSFEGGSGYIIRCCAEGKIKGYISQKVLIESRKNAAEDMGEEAVKALEYVFRKGFLTMIEDGAGTELEHAHNSFDNKKDAPIIAAAKQTSRVTFLLSLDKGFFKPKVIESIILNMRLGYKYKLISGKEKKIFTERDLQ